METPEEQSFSTNFPLHLRQFKFALRKSANSDKLECTDFIRTSESSLQATGKRTRRLFQICLRLSERRSSGSTANLILELDFRRNPRAGFRRLRSLMRFTIM